jgi:hypothetical protein
VNITRRGFISMLAIAGTGAVLLPNRKIFLPAPRSAMGCYGDFTVQNLRYKYTERYSHGFIDWEGIYGSGDLNESTLERAVEDIVKYGRSVMAVKVNRLLVHPDKVEAAKIAFPGQVEPVNYFASTSTWYLKTDAEDMKMADVLERAALANSICVRRA